MAVALELPTRLAEILNSYEVPVVVIGKLRGIKVVDRRLRRSCCARAGFRRISPSVKARRCDLSFNPTVKTYRVARGGHAHQNGGATNLERMQTGHTSAQSHRHSCQITRRLFTPHSKKAEESDADASSEEEIEPNTRHSYNPSAITPHTVAHCWVNLGSATVSISLSTIRCPTELR